MKISTPLCVCLLSLSPLLSACVDEADLDTELEMLDAEYELDAEIDAEFDAELELDAELAQALGDEQLGLEGLSEDASNESFQCGPVGNWAQGNAPTPWFDGSNCYVTNLPQGVQPFVWANGWYVQPGAGNSCAIGSYDGANCYIGSAPSGTTAFIWANNIYFTPTSLTIVPSGSHKTCIGAGSAQQMEADCVAAAQMWTGLYNSGSYDYTTHWGQQCPAGSSPLPQTEYYVQGSCQPIYYGGQGCAGPGSLNYEFKIGVQCL